MKKILILVLSADFHPYGDMVRTSMSTWDSIDEAGMETVYYFGNHKHSSTPHVVYPSTGLRLPIDESLHNMGLKTILALEWALQNKEWDFIARPHSCIYVNKKELREYIESLPSENVFSGLQVVDKQNWVWGGAGLVFSRDVVKKIVGGKNLLDNKLMEDVALSDIATRLGIPFTQGRGCSIDLLRDSSGRFDNWRCTSYGTESFLFTDFADIKKSKGQYFYRIKQDEDREQDEIVMRELFKNLNS